MNRVEALWPLGRYTFGWLGALTARVRYYGSERIPPTGGVVLALNHFSWIDIPCFGVACPRNTYFVAKVEAHRVPGLGQFIRTFGAISIRRGESDREAVRQMRQVVRDGNVLGVFVEGTRQSPAFPARRSPAPRWSRCRRTCPSSAGRSTARRAARSGTSPRRPSPGASRSASRACPRSEGLPRGLAGDPAGDPPALELGEGRARGGTAAERDAAARARAPPRTDRAAVATATAG